MIKGIVLFLSLMICMAQTCLAGDSSLADSFGKGMVYQKAGRDSEAISEYKQVLAIKPEHSNAFYNISQLYFKSGDFEEAARGFKRVTELNPSDGEAYFALAVSYARLYRYADAILNNNKAKELGVSLAKEFEKELDPWIEKERDFNYTSSFTGQGCVVKIRGPVIGDDELVTDILKNIEIFTHSSAEGLFNNVEAKFIGLGDKEEGKWWFRVRWDDGTEKIFTIVLIASKGGTNIVVKE